MKFEKLHWLNLKRKLLSSANISSVESPLSLLPEIFRQIGSQVTHYAEWMKERILSLKEALFYLKSNFSEIMECLTSLFVLVIEKIILLAILLPLGLLYALRKAYCWLAQEELDVWIASSGMSGKSENLGGSTESK